MYYGFAFPNTAYAKLWTGVGIAELAWQGCSYLGDSLRADPLTMVAIAAALAAGLLAKQWRGRAVAVGLGLYLAYVVRVGGDFMSGRFLTPPFMVAVCLLVQWPCETRPAVRALPFAVVCIIAMLWPSSLLAAAGRTVLDTTIPPSGIADERAQYYHLTGLLRPAGAWTAPRTPHWDLVDRMRASGQRVAVRDMVGFFGYAARDDIHVIDSLGLGDPLLARLPAELGWRIGHFYRRLPDGYVDSLKSGTNVIADPHLAHYYAQLRTITRAPIWQKARLLTIVRMSLGMYEQDRVAYTRNLGGTRASRQP